jgi:hypothetical protein
MMEAPTNLIGACGDDCSCCPRYRATIGNDPGELSRVKELWVAFGWRAPDIDVQELKCSGCGIGNKCSYPELRDCAFGKGHGNCGRCATYPCELVKAAFLKTERALGPIREGIGTPEEMALITKAFRNKKSNLDDIHHASFDLDPKESS